VSSLFLSSRGATLIGLAASVVLSLAHPVDASEAPVVHAPVGGAPFALPGGNILCSPVPDGWDVAANATLVRPPTEDRFVGRSIPASMASSRKDCEASSSSVKLRATGPLPIVERRSVVVRVAEGRIDLKGRNVDGTTLRWEAGGVAGTDTCVASDGQGGQQACGYSVRGNLTTDSARQSLYLLPRGARFAPHASFFDATGKPIELDDLVLAPARYILGDLVAADTPLDLSTGEARLVLSHPEAVGSVVCEDARCAIEDGHVVVRGLAGPLSSLGMQFTLLPRIVVEEGEGTSSTVAVRLPVALCSMSVASGEPLRDVDDARIVVRLDRRCGGAARSLRWTANGRPSEVLQVEQGESAAFVVLVVGRITAQELSIVAMRPDAGASVVALTSMGTGPAPRIRSMLELPGYGDIDFIPTNREAQLRVEPPPPGVVLTPQSLAGAYSIRSVDGVHRIRGVSGAGGFVGLRFGYRVASLPPELRNVDLAVLSELVQRPIREAKVPAPIGASVSGANPLAELRCGPGDSATVVEVGKQVHLPWDWRDSCRLILHRARIAPSFGEQRLDVEVDVISRGGSSRSEGKLSQQLVLRHGREPRVIWVHGVKEQFDRISVRITHVIDESQYLRSPSERVEMPSSQWSVVMEDADFRFYATATIPTNLYRFSGDPESLGTGPLALNFGVLSRLTWLNGDGSDGLLGLELGVMGMGIASEKDRQLNIVGGLGVSVPLGNVGQPSQAALGVHAWAGYRLGAQTGERESGELIDLSPWSFIFGPSVSIGSVGVNL
jgi:hypothetical protein